jgi:hypothetical protein
MGPGTFDQGHGRHRAPTQAIAEPGDEFQASRSAAHDHDAVFAGALARAWRALSRGRLGAQIGRMIDCLRHAPYSR